MDHPSHPTATIHEAEESFNSNTVSVAAEKDVYADTVSDEALEASAGTRCTCTYLPSRLSTKFRFLVSAFS
jgi:hypothetical protein